MRKADPQLTLNEKTNLLQGQISSADDAEKQRLTAMIAFRKSAQAHSFYREMIQYNAPDFIERACAYSKKILMSEEKVSSKKLEGNILEKIAAKYKRVALLYRFFNTSAKRANRSMGSEGTRGVLGGYITDGFYQSPKLFPEYKPSKNELSFFEKLKRNSAGTVEMRNRYRRVMTLSLSKNRIAYFNRQKRDGAGTFQNPILIASIGGGTGSLEMDLQQHLREHHGLHSLIVIFDVVDQNRIDGSFFARMRGARICWIIQRPGVDDLLARQADGTLENFLVSSLRGVDACGNDVRIADDLCGRFHHIIMSGLWAKFNDADVLDFLAVTNRLLCRGAQAVVTLSVNRHVHKHFGEKVIPALQIIDHLGHAEGGVWYRSLASLQKSGLLKKSGFIVAEQLHGPIFPVIAIEPV